ncbi:hypothetical protein DMC25_23060 [Caulobacter sp. D4A]|uniref:transglutaminase domain-containing protein n=1 Tax=unclassified Caulobacter TaxID=2648921 RepID=UPI000D732A63|nr:MULTISPECIES: transglutaminase domain-containing protein [unclassified Caulobacter]PXA77560.1 hypothetical protein DMC25_23060 [Caulobacter sp. D4A]PXA95621.1 hypothetical protein DMC18_03625 [Caulobacter sp. D5]
MTRDERCWAALGLATALGLALAAPGAAQTTEALSALPSVRITKGQLAAPSSVSTWSGEQVDGLCRNFAEVTAICPAGGRPVAPEVKALATALRHDPDLIYEYVRNSVDTEFLFGAHKGALGVIIDRSGSPFDQAMLMVELLRESGFTARYKFGTLTLVTEGFQAWTGISNAAAACRLLADSGTPAIINGTTDPTCGYTGDVTSVTMSHVWVEADIGGGSYFFDPSAKPYEHRAGIDFRTAMGFDASGLWSAVTGGMTAGTESGVGYVSNLNQEQLSAKLQQFTVAADARLKQADLAGADMVDVIGGRRLIAAGDRPVGGWRQSRPAKYSESATWAGIPSAFRNKIILRSAVTSSLNGQAYELVSAAFFTDEIYGRRLELMSEPLGSAVEASQWIPTVKFDGETLQQGNPLPFTGSLIIPLDIQINHPFPNGYGDVVITKTIDIYAPAAIVHGWGRSSANLEAKWASEQAFDNVGYVTTKSADSDIEVHEGVGDLTRSRVAAAWLAESSRAGELLSEMAGARFVPLHSVGVVSSDQNNAAVPSAPGINPKPANSGFVTNDEVTIVDVESSFSVVSRSGDLSAQRTAVHAIAAVDAALEGGVMVQALDTPDAISTAARLAWGNRPEANETPDLAPRRIYRFTSSADAASALNLSVYDGGSGPLAAYGDAPAVTQSQVDFMRGKLSGAIKSYVDAGFEVVASNESSLGPGHRTGTEYATWSALVSIGAVSYSVIEPFRCSVSIEVGDPEYEDGLPTLTPTLDTGDGLSCPMSSAPQIATVDKFRDGSANITINSYERGPSLQRGGALIATRYDPSGDPLEIAHALTRYGMLTKGGGAPAVSSLEISKVGHDRSPLIASAAAGGATSFSSPTETSIGSGEFPYRLERHTELRGGSYPSFPDYLDDASRQTYRPGAGPVSNWEAGAEISSSVWEAFGQSRIQASASTLAAFAAMQWVWSQPRSAQREVSGALIADWWLKSWRHNLVTVQQGASSESFVRFSDGGYWPAGGGASRLTVSGSPLLVRPPYLRTNLAFGAKQSKAVVRAWDYSGMAMSLRGGGGDIRAYSYFGRKPAVPGASGQPDALRGFRLASWTFPRGVQLSLLYPTTGDYRPSRINSSLGYGLDLAITAPTIGCEAVTSTDASLQVTKMTPRPPIARSISQRPDPNCRPLEVFGPADTTTPLVRYGYDPVGRVVESRDRLGAVQERPAYGFLIADGYRAETLDPMGGRYAIETLPGGGLVVGTASVAGQVRNIDELGRTTRSLMDGRGRVFKRTYPEGNYDQFEYDDRDNVTKVIKGGKPGSALADLVVTAEYDTVFNKPLWLKNARAHRTDYTYVASGAGAGEIASIIQPVVNGVRPVWSFEYGAAGLPTKVTDPTGVVTATAYDALGNPKTSILDSTGVNAQACKTFDAVGNVTSERDPRAGACP